ncbi:tetraacyldisaccharide 4'-kinase [Burkholderiales bacterium GJ-E10]|nr:tetraacyldisaccharide 4'-kinase [Burkholderiales bacterium GJ-E10]
MRFGRGCAPVSGAVAVGFRARYAAIFRAAFRVQFERGFGTGWVLSRGTLAALVGVRFRHAVGAGSGTGYFFD